MRILLPIFGILAALLSLIAYIPYIRDILRGTTKPERASWFIWTALAIIAVTSQKASGAHWSLLMSIVQMFGVATISVLSIKRGYGGLKKRDVASLFAAMLGIVGWAVTNQPIVALICVIFVDAAGAWLTTYKAYLDPDSETLSTWQLDTISNFFGVLAVGAFNITLMMYPLYLLIANGSVMVAIYLARNKKLAH